MAEYQKRFVSMIDDPKVKALRASLQHGDDAKARADMEAEHDFAAAVESLRRRQQELDPDAAAALGAAMEAEYPWQKKTDAIDLLATELRQRWGCQDLEEFVEDLERIVDRKVARYWYTVGSISFLAGIATALLVVFSGWVM